MKPRPVSPAKLRPILNGIGEVIRGARAVEKDMKELRARGPGLAYAGKPARPTVRKRGR